MQQASDCDIVVAHDNDLVTIDGIGNGSYGTVSGPLNSDYLSFPCWQLLETLEPNVMMDLLRRSNIKIHKVLCGGPPTPIESRL
jgi:hypothetical protein